MTTVDQTRSFIDTGLARMSALLIAAGLAFLLWSNWSADFKNLFAGDDGAAPSTKTVEPAKPMNPALENCFVKRIGDVDQMKDDGILSDAQYDAFRSRAESLCRAQNPG